MRITVTAAGLVATMALAFAASPASATVNCPTPATLTSIGTCEIVFTSSGSFTAPAGVTALDVLVVGGGGGGGDDGGVTSYAGGGGGGGEVVISTALPVVSGATYAVTVGVGGAAATLDDPITPAPSGNGGASSFGAVSAAGGHGGGRISGGSSGNGNLGGGLAGYPMSARHGAPGGGGAASGGTNSGGRAGGGGGPAVDATATEAFAELLPAYYGGGGGGGGGTYGGVAGSGGWGPYLVGAGGGNAQTGTCSPSCTPTPNTGSGGGGRGYKLDGTPVGGSAGADGVVVVRFAVPLVPPSAPTAVSAAASGTSGATVSWTAPDSDGNSPITGYTATAQPGGKTCRATAPALTCAIADLGAGTFTFTVVATNAIGDSAASAASSPLALAGEPSSAPAGDSTADTAADQPTTSGRAFIPATARRSGIAVSYAGTALVPISCSRATGCRVSGVVTFREPQRVSAMRTRGAVIVLARFAAMTIAAGKHRSVRVVIAAAELARLQAAGITMVRATVTLRDSAGPNPTRVTRSTVRLRIPRIVTGGVTG